MQLIDIAASAVAASLIPGGAIIVMTPILTSASIPLSGMAMLLAVDTIPDMFRTTANVTDWLAVGATLSSQDDVIDPLSKKLQADLNSTS